MTDPFMTLHNLVQLIRRKLPLLEDNKELLYDRKNNIYNVARYHGDKNQHVNMYGPFVENQLIPLARGLAFLKGRPRFHHCYILNRKGLYVPEIAVPMSIRFEATSEKWKHKIGVDETYTTVINNLYEQDWHRETPKPKVYGQLDFDRDTYSEDI